MMTWKASQSSLCRDSGAEPVVFATDVDSSCSLQVAADNITDCESLARSVRLIQDSLLPVTHVAKGGNPNVTLRSDFVRVVLVDPLEVQEENATADNITSHHSGVNRTSTMTTEPPPTIATAPAPSPPALPVASCVVPSRVSVHVMYSRSDPGGGAGDNSEKPPIYRVNGVRIKLGHERWDWTCRKRSSGDGGGGCREAARYDL